MHHSENKLTIKLSHNYAKKKPIKMASVSSYLQVKCNNASIMVNQKQQCVVIV